MGEWKPKLETKEEKAYCFAHADMATCEECGFTGKVAEFHAETEQEGWETPPNVVHYCPRCNGGVAGYYFPSEESIARYEKDGS